MTIDFYPPKLTDHELAQLLLLARKLKDFAQLQAWLFDWCARETERRKHPDREAGYAELGYTHPEDLAAMNLQVSVLVTTGVFTPSQERFINALHGAVTAHVNILLRHMARGGHWRDLENLEETE